MDIKKILRPLFFNRSLPIGYVTSPKISDFYLYDLDEAMKGIDGVVYTRYADDILLSSKDPERLKDACKFLFGRLKAERLSINEAKTINKSLAHFDDSIRFLGINMVKRQNGYEYTASRQYLVKTSKLIEKVEAQNRRLLTAGRKAKKKIFELRQKAKGRVEYIKYISTDSFQKLKKLVLVKLKHWPSFLD